MKHKIIAFLDSIAQTLLPAPPAISHTPARFEIRFDTSSLTADQRTLLQPVLDEAATFWESLILGYQPGVTLDGIDIEVSAITIDGRSNILAQAGTGPGSPFSQAGFDFITNGTVFTAGSSIGVTSSVGTLRFDEADLNTPLLVDIAKHEIAHAIGFSPARLTANDLFDGVGQYGGAEGLAAFQAEFVPKAGFVPFENDNTHFWESSILTDRQGRVMGHELMTPIIKNTLNSTDPTSNFVSNTTLGIFRDLGYDTLRSASDIPKPSITQFALSILTLRRRRYRAGRFANPTKKFIQNPKSEIRNLKSEI